MVLLVELLPPELFITALAFSMPVLYAALGENYAESSGVANFGLEGIMLISAILSFIIALITKDILLGVLLGVAGGAAFSLLVGFFSISLRVDQIVLAIGVIIFGPGVSSFMYGVITPIYQRPPIKVDTFPPVGQSDLPIIDVLLRQNLLTYLGLVLIPLTWFILYRTSFGLKLRACGEDPRAADAMGINVFRIRYLCVVISGVLAAIGGIFVVQGFSGMWQDNIVGGRGFVGIAMLRVGNWKPQWTFPAAYIYGFFDTFQYRLWLQLSEIPSEFLLMLPYAIAIALLAGASRWRRTMQPASLAIPYKRG